MWPGHFLQIQSTGCIIVWVGDSLYQIAKGVSQKSLKRFLQKVCYEDTFYKKVEKQKEKMWNTRWGHFPRSQST